MRVPSQEDMLLRAVRFLDTMIQRDNLQKAAFLKDMGSIWPRVDARVVKFRMLPPLLAEARTEALQPVLLPLVLAMLEQQTDQVQLILSPSVFFVFSPGLTPRSPCCCPSAIYARAADRSGSTSPILPVFSPILRWRAMALCGLRWYHLLIPEALSGKVCQLLRVTEYYG